MLREVEFKDVKNRSILIDVRSPSEYAQGTIYGAINIPILDDFERKAVGTAYKQINKNEARRLGIKFVSTKLPDYFERVLELKNAKKELVAFCARGGYRSTAFASIFSAIGMNVSRMKDGYKGYRNYIKDELPKINEKLEYIVIHGNTGVGKTDILYELNKLGCDILDIEGAANHRGSLLGGIGIGESNSQKVFDSNLFYQLDNVKSNFVFVEAESKKIGQSTIPDCVFQKMQQGIHINIDANIQYRIRSLKKDYIVNKNWIEESKNAIEHLRKYISNHKVDELLLCLDNNDFDTVAKELMINYYDPMYMHKANQYTYKAQFKAITSARETAQEIKDYFNINNN